MVAYLNFDGAKAVTEDIRAAGGSATAVPVDLGDVENVRAMVTAAVETYGGGLDVLHDNAAAIHLAARQYLAVLEADPAVPDDTMRLRPPHRHSHGPRAPLLTAQLISGSTVVGGDGLLASSFDLVTRTSAMIGSGRGVTEVKQITGNIVVGDNFAPNSTATAWSQAARRFRPLTRSQPTALSTPPSGCRMRRRRGAKPRG